MVDWLPAEALAESLGLALWFGNKVPPGNVVVTVLLDHHLYLQARNIIIKTQQMLTWFHFYAVLHRLYMAEATLILFTSRFISCAEKSQTYVVLV
jgi:hypothetical protein